MSLHISWNLSPSWQQSAHSSKEQLASSLQRGPNWHHTRLMWAAAAHTGDGHISNDRLNAHGSLMICLRCCRATVGASAELRPFMTGSVRPWSAAPLKSAPAHCTLAAVDFADLCIHSACSVVMLWNSTTVQPAIFCAQTADALCIRTHSQHRDFLITTPVGAAAVNLLLT